MLFHYYLELYYFQDEKLFNRSKKILKKELSEQILNDGGHFEAFAYVSSNNII